MPSAFSEASYLLNRRQSPVFVEARNRVVDDDNLIGDVRVLVQRREEERERKGIPIARAESVAERGSPGTGSDPSMGTGVLLMRTLYVQVGPPRVFAYVTLSKRNPALNLGR